MTDRSWMDQAKCLEHDPDIWFKSRGMSNQEAKSICYECPVILECRIYSLSWSLESNGVYRLYGTWGGLSGSERKNRRMAEILLLEAQAELEKEPEERIFYGCRRSD